MCWCWVAIDSSRVTPSEKVRKTFSCLAFQSCLLPFKPSGTWATVFTHAQNFHRPMSGSHIAACLLLWANKQKVSLTTEWITFHSHEDCFESLLQESSLHHQLQGFFHVCCILKGPVLGVEGEMRSEIKVWFFWIWHGGKDVIFKENLFTFLLSKLHD